MTQHKFDSTNTIFHGTRKEYTLTHSIFTRYLRNNIEILVCADDKCNQPTKELGVGDRIVSKEGRGRRINALYHKVCAEKLNLI